MRHIYSDDGEALYQHKHPTYVEVVLWKDRHFAREPFLVRNPAEPTPWHLLTRESRESWRRQAVGHHIFSKEPT